MIHSLDFLENWFLSKLLNYKKVTSWLSPFLVTKSVGSLALQSLSEAGVVCRIQVHVLLPFPSWMSWVVCKVLMRVRAHSTARWPYQVELLNPVSFSGATWPVVRGNPFPLSSLESSVLGLVVMDLRLAA